jgi:hypothetical protein
MKEASAGEYSISAGVDTPRPARLNSHVSTCHAFADTSDRKARDEKYVARGCHIDCGNRPARDVANWPAPGSADTELGVLMEPEVSHGKAEVYTRVQA